MNIYLDCGFYHGVALKHLLDTGVVNNNWKIYAFEPNRDLKIDFTQFPVEMSFSREAVWIKDGRVKFHIAGREDSASIKNTTGHTEPKEITVPSIDFSRFVGGLPEAFIWCNMDIEGAEFKVLDKMITDGTITKINFLDIEFHHRFMNDYTKKEAQDLIDKIESLGVGVNLKVPLE